MPFTPVSATEAAARAAQTLATNTTTYTQTYSSETPKYGFSISLVSREAFLNATGGVIAAGGQIPIGGVVGGSGIPAFGPGFGTAAAPPVDGANIGTNLGTIWLPEPVGRTMIDKQEVEFSEYAAGTALANLLTFGAAGALVEPFSALTGFAPNQFFTVVLKGPKYKRYHLEFPLAPRSAQDSTNIRNIIRTLRAAAAPGAAAEGWAWRFPQIALCSYVPQGNDPQSTFMYAFKPAVMEMVEARYADNAPVVGFYRGTGAPEAVVLAIDFLEIEYWTSRDYGGPN